MTRLGVIAVAVAVSAAVAQEPAPARPSYPGALAALRASVEIERTLLQEDRQHHAQLRTERAELNARATEIQAAVDAALGAEEVPPAARLDALLHDSAQVERQRVALAADERALLERIRDRLRRIDLLQERIAAMSEAGVEMRGLLSGTWEVAVMPSGQRGTFSLVQSGTLVTGTYTLDGGWSGSLQGTLIQRKVVLERIDARAGRWGKYEATLSADGNTMRGAWIRLDAGAEDGAEGQWIGTRQPAGP